MFFQNRFSNTPLLAWTVDDWEQFYELLGQFDLKSYLKKYKERSFDENISLLFEKASLNLNLGGQTEKTKLVTTDKPIGIFDFSLASRGLYRVPEYFSEKLYREFPEKFKEFELPSGVVPNNLVQQEIVNDEKKFFFEDCDGRFDCQVQQKGKAAIEEGLPDAKLKFATRNKKVYLTYNRKRGKVKYVEIYSLFYYTSLSGDVQYAIRHIPAMMVAEYLESIGVMTRIYMTRFVLLEGSRNRMLANKYNGLTLPMASLIPDSAQRNNTLFVQPIIAKEFGQEFDKELAFLISSRNQRQVYETLAVASQQKELNGGVDIYGEPRWKQNDYWEGIERYRNKYKEYVKKGIFKSKEVLPEAMLFFHDYAIKEYFESFSQNIRYFYQEKFNNYLEEAKLLILPEINPFFNWWMRISATNLKNKINIINSLELRKDLAAIDVDMQKLIDEVNLIVENAADWTNSSGNTLKDYLGKTKNSILRTYSVYNKRNIYTFKSYILSITTEITTYAEGNYYATPQEDIDKRNDLVETVISELQNF